MMNTATLPAPAQLTEKHRRLVSFEPSHSWLKRADSEGVLTIQAGYRLNPQGRNRTDDENPLIVFEGQKRLYGAIACQGAHESPLNHRKEANPRMGFAACLRPSDDGKDLTVIVSHWDESVGAQIAQSLTGPYSVTRNGHQIHCNVKEAYAQLEDQGTYQLMKPQLKPGKTLLIGSGHGTSQEWFVDSDGYFRGESTENLAVMKLVQMIANDQAVRAAALRLGEQTVNPDLVAQSLRSGQFGSLPTEHWEAIRDRYVGQWYEGFKNYLLKVHGPELQSTANIVFSGGGAELLRSRVGKFAMIPTNAQTASVRGAYAHHAALLGVR
jgi:hypothetical protein